MRRNEPLEVELDAAGWTELDLWALTIIQLVAEGLIKADEAAEFSFGGSMALTDEDPATGYIMEETAILCDTSMERLDWLEDREGKAFHYRLQNVLEKAVFFRNKEKSS